MGFRLKDSGRFNKTETWIAKLLRNDYGGIFERYGQIGVSALAEATPKDTGLAAQSWYYDVQQDGKNGVLISWLNDNVEDGYHVVIGIQYGHGTGTGGYVGGIDFINPAMEPVFDAIIDDLIKEVSR